MDTQLQKANIKVQPKIKLSSIVIKNKENKVINEIINEAKEDKYDNK